MIYKVIKNFCEKDHFDNLKNFLFSKNCPWFFLDSMTNNPKKKDHYFFNHCFYSHHEIQSREWYLIDPIVKKINMSGINEIRANLTLKKEKVYKSNWHNDRPYPCNTAILYMNTCNGYTLLDKNKKIKIPSVENSLLLFDSSVEHQMVSHTDVDRRVVLNMNYF